METKKLDFIRSIAKDCSLCEFISSESVREFIACQFALESDYGCSVHSVSDCNISGMKIPFKRYSVRSGSSSVYASYLTWHECIKDYLLWIFYNRPSQNTFDSVYNYSVFLRDREYCPEKDYISKILSIYNQFINSKN